MRVVARRASTVFSLPPSIWLLSSVLFAVLVRRLKVYSYTYSATDQVVSTNCQNRRVLWNGVTQSKL